MVIVDDLGVQQQHGARKSNSSTTNCRRQALFIVVFLAALLGVLLLLAVFANSSSASPAAASSSASAPSDSRTALLTMTKKSVRVSESVAPAITRALTTTDDGGGDVASSQGIVAVDSQQQRTEAAPPRTSAETTSQAPAAATTSNSATNLPSTSSSASSASPPLLINDYTADGGPACYTTDPATNSIESIRNARDDIALLSDVAKRTFLIAVPTNSNSNSNSNNASSENSFETWLSLHFCGRSRRKVIDVSGVGSFTLLELHAAPPPPAKTSNNNYNEWIAGLLLGSMNNRSRMETLVFLHDHITMLQRSASIKAWRRPTMHLGFLVDGATVDFAGQDARRLWKYHVEENRTFIGFRSRRSNRRSARSSRSNTNTISSVTTAASSSLLLPSGCCGVIESLTPADVAAVTGGGGGAAAEASLLDWFADKFTRTMASFLQQQHQQPKPANLDVASSTEAAAVQEQEQDHEILFAITEGAVDRHHFGVATTKSSFYDVVSNSDVNNNTTAATTATPPIRDSLIRIGPQVGFIPSTQRFTRPFLGVGPPEESKNEFRSYSHSNAKRFSSEQLCPPVDGRIIVHIPLYWECFDHAKATTGFSSPSASSSDGTARSTRSSSAGDVPFATANSRDELVSCPRLDIFEEMLFKHLDTIQWRTDIFLHVHRERMPLLPRKHLKRIMSFRARGRDRGGGNSGSITFVDHVQEEHGWYLPWKVRRLMANQVGLADVFLYTEDDLGINQKTLEYFCQYHLKVQRLGGGNAQLGYMRFEVAPGGARYPSDRDALYAHDVARVNNDFTSSNSNTAAATATTSDRWFYSLSGVAYSAHFFVTGSDLRVLRTMPMWLPRQERLVRKCAQAPNITSLNEMHRQCGLPQMIREEAAYFNAPPRMLLGLNTVSLFPIDLNSYCVLESALIHHIGNHPKYYNMPGYVARKKLLMEGICVNKRMFDEQSPVSSPPSTRGRNYAFDHGRQQQQQLPQQQQARPRPPPPQQQQQELSEEQVQERLQRMRRMQNSRRRP